MLRQATNGSMDYHSHTNGPVGPTSHLLTQIEAFSRSDADRQALLKTLYDRCLELSQELQNCKNDYDNEKWSRNQWQNRARAAEQQLEGSPFALALIDGDGAMFQEHLLKSGPLGGSEAAHKLHKEIKSTIQMNMPIMVQIYTNVEDLSRKLADVGIISEPSIFNGFAGHFSLAQPLFSIIDVGRGKERADAKIREMFRLFANNVQCKHIIFGGCHDNGYMNDLEPIRHQKDIASKMTLLETTPANWQFKSLGIPVVRYSEVFREDALPSRPPGAQHQQYLPPPLPPPPGLPSHSSATPTPITPSQPAASSLNPNANVFSTQARPAATTASSSGNVFASSSPPATNGVGSPASQPINPARGHTPSTTQSAQATGGTSTWATISKTSPASRSISLVSVPKPNAEQAVQRRFIIYNASGQRLDEKLIKPDYDAQQSVKERIAIQKLCNNYHLRGKCQNPSTCNYQHGERLNKKERHALLHKTRSTACTAKKYCTDPDCYLSHMCANGPECTWRRDQCWHEHLADMTPYKKVYDDSSEEIIAT